MEIPAKTSLNTMSVGAHFDVYKINLIGLPRSERINFIEASE